jgi:hypothetical protein
VSVDLRLRGKSLWRISSVECDNLPKSQRPKKIATVHCREHVARDPEVQRLNALKGSRRGRRISEPSDPEGHMAGIIHLWVKPLWEE